MMSRNELVQKTRTALEAVCQTTIDLCKTGHRKFLEKEQQRINFERVNRIECHQNEVRKELALVMAQADYPRLNAVHSIMDLRPDGYTIGNGKVIHFFTVDKVVWERFPAVVCQTICSNINKDIITYRNSLAQSMTAQEAFCLYPALYYGFYVAHIEDQDTSVRLGVIADMPL